MRVYREVTIDYEDIQFLDCSHVIINGKKHYCYVYHAYGNMYIYTEEDLYENITFSFKLKHNSLSDFDLIVKGNKTIFTGNLKEILDTFRIRPFYK